MKPYNPNACCGVDCAFNGRGRQSEPCWGDVTVIDEVQYGDDDYGWVHVCEGHKDVYDDGIYIPQSATCSDEKSC